MFSFKLFKLVIIRTFMFHFEFIIKKFFFIAFFLITLDFKASTQIKQMLKVPNPQFKTNTRYRTIICGKKTIKDYFFFESL